MATMDIFNDNAFSLVELTGVLEQFPHQPALLGQLGLFTPRPIRGETVGIESRAGVLSLIQTSARGTPVGERETEKRDLRDFRTRRIGKGDTLTAAEIQGIRAFGSESELMQVQAEVARRLAGPSGLIRDIELTWEHMRMGAVQGIVTDADNSVIYNWYTEFGVQQPAEIDFDLDNASPESGAVRKKCNQVVRQMMKASAGAWIPGRTSVVGLCGDNFFDYLTMHPEVRQTYLNTAQASDLRDHAMPYENFRYGGITWINYRGTDDGSTVAIPTDLVKFLPAHTPGVFEVAFSPMESLEFVNTPGREMYSLMVPDRDRNMWVRVEVYSYPLFMCTRPAMLQRGKRT